MALGEILRNARIQKGLTPSDVAEHTRMMVQVVESLEREDFRRIAAPIYGRGFIKLYAELLELDPEPLIRDFMEIYDGARAPAVKMKKVEADEEPAPLTPPVTRTVSGVAPLSPQRQPVQPRPAVRPVVVAQEEAPIVVEESAAPEPLKIEPERALASEPGSAAVGAVQAEMAAATPSKETEGARAWVVEPEEPFHESDEPDLFRPLPPRRQPSASASSEGQAASAETRRERKLPKLPIFQIGGRMEAAHREAPPHDEEAHAQRHERIQAFLDGVSKLRSGVESRLPLVMPHKKVLLLGGAAVLALVFMTAGVAVLFKLTGGNVKESPSGVLDKTTPPPALYVD